MMMMVSVHWPMVIIELGKKKMRSSAPIHLCAVDESMEKLIETTSKTENFTEDFEKNDFDCIDSFTIVDLGLWCTESMSDLESDDADIVDWKAPVIKITYRESPYIIKEAV